MKKISIVVPIYNEEKVIPFFKNRILNIIKKEEKYEIEVLFVDDGSNDKSIEIIKNIRKQDKRFSYISLSRNFGKEIAIYAGLDYAKESDAVVLIDADLQDPPELIPKLIEQWENGYDDVYAKRKRREGESFIKKITSKMYYIVLQKFTNIPIQKDTGDFRLLDKRCVQAICNLKEEARCSKSLFSLIGYNKKEVLFERDKRIAGTTKWNYKKLVNLAIDGITSFTISPLRWSTYLGSIIFLTGLIYITSILFHSNEIQGYQIVLSTVLFLGGLQFFIIGVMRRIYRKNF